MGIFTYLKRKRSKFPNNVYPRRTIKDRDSDRIDCELSIVFANHDTGEIAKGSVLNYSKRGLYIETDHCPIVGRGALVYMTEYSPRAEDPNYLQKYYVQVKWIKKISEAGNQKRYGIGVKHCNSYDEMLRLFA